MRHGIPRSIPSRLTGGDSVEYWTGGPARVFDRNGHLRSTVDLVGGPIQLQPGLNRVLLRGTPPAAAKFTLITTGKSIGEISDAR